MAKKRPTLASAVKHDLYNEYARLAKESGMSISYFVRRALYQYLDTTFVDVKVTEKPKEK